jgi:two-component system, OmpR family, response regulator
MRGCQDYRTTECRQAAGALFCDDELMRREVSKFLDNYFRIHDRPLSDLNMAELLLDRSDLGFVVLCSDDPQCICSALRRVRSRSSVGVIVVGPAIEQHCVLALEGGADDYMGKPASLREMLARIRGILRFERPPNRRESPAEKISYLFCGWRYDNDLAQLINPHGRRIPVTRGERSILKIFLNAPHRVLTRKYLVNALRSHEDITDRSIDTRILRLRRKLTIEGGKQDVIRTVRGHGYAFSVDVEREDMEHKELWGMFEYASNAGGREPTAA